VNKQKQSGFTHIMIVTIILGLAVVGLLGFVFWQNFMQPKTTTTKDAKDAGTIKDIIDQASTPTGSTNSTSASTAGYLVLDDWGVKFKLPTDLASGNQITYHKTHNDYWGDQYEFSTTRVEALGEACVPTSQSFTSLGKLYKLSSPSTVEASAPTLLGKIDNHYYLLCEPPVNLFG
jgi:hypothetical protein